MNRSTSTVLLALFATLCWPQTALATGFDFQLLEFQIIGENAFFDDFEDGLRDSAPTSRLLPSRGVVTESGGALQFDGALTPPLPSGTLPDFLNTNVRFDTLFTDGGGGAVITATWGPAVPSVDYTGFALALDSPNSQGRFFFFAFDLGRLDQAGVTSPCGNGVQVTFSFVGTSVGGCDSFDPADVTGNSVLKLILDDERDEVRGLYSIDGGKTFTSLTGFDVPPQSADLFEFGPVASLRILGLGVPEPATATLLLCAALALAKARSRRTG